MSRQDNGMGWPAAKGSHPVGPWIPSIDDCPSTMLGAVSPSTPLRTLSLSKGLSNGRLQISEVRGARRPPRTSAIVDLQSAI